MADSHLTDRDIADRLAGVGDAAAPDGGVARHLANCDVCRASLERAEAMLDLAAALTVEDGTMAGCPDALRLATYVDGKLDGAQVQTTETHLATCSECRDVVDRVLASNVKSSGPVGSGSVGPGRMPRLWFSGALLLATAAVVAVFFYFPREPLIRLNVNVLAIGATRGAPADVEAAEFELNVDVRHRAWVTLLVVDSKGALTLLEERQVEASTTFGRYAMHSPGTVPGEADRRYVVVLMSESSLMDRLTEIDVSPISMAADAHANKLALSTLCSQLSEQLKCVAEFAPIKNPYAE